MKTSLYSLYINIIIDRLIQDIKIWNENKFKCIPSGALLSSFRRISCTSQGRGKDTCWEQSQRSFNWPLFSRFTVSAMVHSHHHQGHEQFLLIMYSFKCLLKKDIIHKNPPNEKINITSFIYFYSHSLKELRVTCKMETNCFKFWCHLKEIQRRC